MPVPRAAWPRMVVSRQALPSGPVSYPWEPKRPRYHYHYRAHELNGAAELLGRGAEAMGYRWTPTPLATVSAPHGHSHSCVYRGFCRDGRATGVRYMRERRWRFQRARNVVMASYAIETPRLLLASATDRHPDGLANGSGPLGKNPMTQSKQAVFGTMDNGVRWNEGPPSLSITGHWNYEDAKDLPGG